MKRTFRLGSTSSGMPVWWRPITPWSFSPTRIAVISSPRSGNTWIRFLLSSIYGLEQVAVFDPFAFDWASAPSRCLFQTHWHPTGRLVETLERHQFRVVVSARHPLDLLISILHFAGHEPLRHPQVSELFEDLKNGIFRFRFLQEH